jgi:Short C-terminal domain
MFMARRRPLLRAAMIGGGAYVAGKHRARAQEAEAQQEQYQDERIAALEQQQQPAPAPVQQAAPPPQAVPAQQAVPAAGGGSALVDRLKELTELKNSGALTEAQFEQAKQQVLGGA